MEKNTVIMSRTKTMLNRSRILDRSYSRAGLVLSGYRTLLLTERIYSPSSRLWAGQPFHHKYDATLTNPMCGCRLRCTLIPHETKLEVEGKIDDRNKKGIGVCW
jgi:hypothetical protein